MTAPPPRITLLCTRCGDPFKTDRIRAVCGLCAHVYQQNPDIIGEVSGA